MGFGGIEKALLEMVKNLPKDKYDITIGVMEKNGELESQIPENVNLINIYDNDESIKLKVLKNIKKFNFFRVYYLISNTMSSYYTKYMYKSYNSISKTLNKLDEEYDIAISYTTPISFPIIYVINNIVAKNKIMWLHSDITQFEDDIISFEKYYHKYNYIFSVSKNGLYKFVNKFPQTKNKSNVYYNSIYEGDIQELANQEVVLKDYSGLVKITTVARLSPEKGIDLLIESAKLLKDNGYDFIWNCIGEGDIRKELEYKI